MNMAPVAGRLMADPGCGRLARMVNEIAARLVCDCSPDGQERLIRAGA